MALGVRKSINRFRLRRLAQQNNRIARVVEQVKQNHLTYLDVQALCDLADLVLSTEASHLEGIMVEAGCGSGGSAIVLASAKSPARPFYVYDTFGLIPPPSENDGADVHERYRLIASGEASGIGGAKYYGYESNLYEKVAQTFSEFGLDLTDNHIHLVRGLYQESMAITSPVALAHIDCDWYDSVWTCLTQIVPNLVPGGTIIVDDYFVWSGCRKAVDDYFACAGSQSYRFVRKSRMHISKI